MKPFLVSMAGFHLDINLFSTNRVKNQNPVSEKFEIFSVKHKSGRFKKKIEA